MLSRVVSGPHHQHAFTAIFTPRPAQYYSLLHQGVSIPHLLLLDGGHSLVRGVTARGLSGAPLLALAGLGPNALRYAWSVKLFARPGSTPRGVEQSIGGLGGFASVAHGHCEGGYAARAGT